MARKTKREDEIIDNVAAETIEINVPTSTDEIINTLNEDIEPIGIAETPNIVETVEEKPEIIEQVVETPKATSVKENTKKNISTKKTKATTLNDFLY